MNNVNESDIKKDGLFERINKRNKERQNNIDGKLEQRNKNNLQLEGVDYFSQSFAERVQLIETSLRNVNETAVKKFNTIESANLTQQFAVITLQIQELQRYLTDSTMFLSDFKIKACQNVLNELQNNCEKTRLRLLPKKKFGFSGKKVATKEKLNPKVMQDAVDAAKKHDLDAETERNSTYNWTLSHRKDEHICLSGEQVNGKDITITHLSNCLVELQGHAGSVQMSHTNNCTLLCGPVSRSLFAEHCENLTLAIACQQLRLHSSKNCRLYLQVTCRAIIEDCTGIDISEYAYDYMGLEQDFQEAGLERTLNNYKDVADFNWLSADVHSPNWQLLSNVQPDWNELRRKYKEKSISCL